MWACPVAGKREAELHQEGISLLRTQKQQLSEVRREKAREYTKSHLQKRGYVWEKIWKDPEQVPHPEAELVIFLLER